MDEDDVIYRLTTALYDCHDSNETNMDNFLKTIKNKLGEDIYLALLEGFVYGRHDT